MTLLETTLWLPPNVVDVYMTDVDGDGEADVVVAAKASGTETPRSNRVVRVSISI